MLAARYMGVSSRRIIVRHILPNVASILIIDTALNVGVAILSETGLSYLGIRHPGARCLAGHADRRRHQIRDHVPLGVLVPRQGCWC